MNSFYHTVNSDGSRHIHPHNHGGDFTVELYDTMDLHGAWEMALIEMSYFEQRFANVPEEYGKIQLTSSAKALYNTQFIVHYHEFDDLFLTVHMWNRSRNEWLQTGEIKLNDKRQHCSFLDLTRIINSTKYHQKDSYRSFDVILELHYSSLTITVVTRKNSVAISLSDKLMKLFSITEKSYEFTKWDKRNTHKIPIVQPPIIIDNSTVLFTPITEEKWIKINGLQLEIPKFYWTYYAFKKAVPIMFKKIFPDFTARFTEIRDSEYYLRIGNLPLKNYVIEISDYLNSFVIVSKFETTCGLDIDFSKMPKDEDIVEEHVSFELAYNYYPTEKSLIADLDSLTSKHVNKFIETKGSDQYVEKRFTLDENSKICSFTSTSNYSVELSSYLLNVLQLHNTYESNTRKGPIRLMSAIRPFLHVYCDLIAPHNVNSEEESLLRVINNVVRQDEKIMLTFDYPHYYPISRRFINNIRIYITDSFSTDPLVFTHQVSYLLHFRPCLPT